MAQLSLSQLNLNWLELRRHSNICIEGASVASQSFINNNNNNNQFRLKKTRIIC
jgi:hypothetical protein